ncbi:MAG TPA: aminotransferase class V-fold PLP-dependent enzyme, partial [Gemmatimonadales bacterium]|nr:aminotransferase class V-fold PLP-dependent enzyme [Gemmatimonadales bacterium]
MSDAAADDADLVERIRALERASRPLEPGTTRRRKIRNAAVASTERYLRKVGDVKGFDDVAGQGAELLNTPIGEHGIPLDDALAVLEEFVIKPGGHPASPGYLSYIPGGGLYHSALGDFLAAVSNKYAGVFFAGPGAVRMENMLLRWAADLVGYPDSAGGNIASGGSIANLTAIVTAREAHGVKSADVASRTIYLTEQAHHSIDKALGIAGLAEAPVRRIPLDERFRMRPDALEQAIAADRAAGFTPWLVVATAGTTDTGAVDPLEAIGSIARRERCWFHVDAAYGGFFLLTEQGRAIMRGIEQSDSVILDPHKGLFLPYGSGIVLVRDAALLESAHHYSGQYMQDALRGASEVSPSDVSPELTKHFRALRMWLPLVVLGTAPFRAALEEKLLLARYFYQHIGRLGFEVGPEPELSIVIYRWAPPGMSLEETNRINREIIDAVRHDGRIFLSSTTLDGRFTLRMVALGFRTHLRTIELALKVLGEAGSGKREAGNGKREARS